MKTVDKVRASRDGHQFHEEWIVHYGLGLLLARDGLCGIAVEGLNKDIEDGLSSAVVEIADATFFYGKAPNIKHSSKIEVIQYKYSIANAEKQFRVCDFKKTITKFSKAESELSQKFGEKVDRNKFHYRLVTNRPVSLHLVNALDLSVPTNRLDRDSKEQRKQLFRAIKLAADERKSFLERFAISSGVQDLDTLEKKNEFTLTEWSSSGDILIKSRLGEIRALARKKAGGKGQNDNLIVKEDILYALGISDENELFPTQNAFPDIGEVVAREQLTDFLEKVGQSSLWIVHATGGVGKTVFLESLAKKLSKENEVVLFDCFGGGAYRSQSDSRHLPERGLMHIINELALKKGLCDPILPGSNDSGEVVRRGLKRLSQAVENYRRTNPSGKVVLLIDAADNAAIAANNMSCFPRDLLESLTHNPVDGLLVICSSRTERQALVDRCGTVAHYQLNNFSFSEASSFIKKRRPEATDSQVRALLARSGGNPRVIANLIDPSLSLNSGGNATGTIDVKTLIEARLRRYLSSAEQNGTTRKAIESFLCALSVLPPPVPVSEIACAFIVPENEIISLASDLSPLLERTPHGLIFRDEPTETLIREEYGNKHSLLETTVTQLTKAQTSSIYAARALPGLLYALKKVPELRELAFSESFPKQLVQNDIAKRDIRRSRLKTALAIAVESKEYNLALEIMVELSSLALADERGKDYLLDNSDLVRAVGDPETLRRLFELKTKWGGKRAARLSIAHTVGGELGEGYLFAVRADSWLRWVESQPPEVYSEIRPELDDRASISFSLLAEKKLISLCKYINSWKQWYGYQLAKRTLELAYLSYSVGCFPKFPKLVSMLKTRRKIPVTLIVAALAEFSEIEKPVVGKLLKQLAQNLRKQDKITDEWAGRRDVDPFRTGLIRCGVRAANMGLFAESKTILEQADIKRYALYALNDPFSDQYVAPWLHKIVLLAVTEQRELNLFDCLPSELWELVKEETCPLGEKEQLELVLSKIEEFKSQKDDGKSGRETLSRSEIYFAPDRVRKQVSDLFEIAKEIRKVITSTTSEEMEASLSHLFGSWEAHQRKATEDNYAYHERIGLLNSTYTFSLSNLLISLCKLDSAMGERLRRCLEACSHSPIEYRLRLIWLLSKKDSSKGVAGSIACDVIKLIKQDEDTVSRAKLYSDLARAILPANRNEAQALFNQGLSELDAVGSGDSELLSQILKYSCTLKGNLSSPAALRVAKMCELNNYNSDKFPWPLTGSAFSKIWGLPFLAQVTRWSDRGTVDLDHLLPSTLSSFVRERIISPEEGSLFLLLSDVVEYWDWNYKDIFQSFIDVKSSSSALTALLGQYEKEHTSGIYYHLKEVSDVLKPYLNDNAGSFNELYNKLVTLEDNSKLLRRVDKDTNYDKDDSWKLRVEEEKEIKEKAVIALISNINPLSNADLEKLVEDITNIDRATGYVEIALVKLEPNIGYSDRHAFLQTFSEVRNVNLYTKLNFFMKLEEKWEKDSPAGLPFKDLSSKLIHTHAEELLEERWGINSNLARISELSQLPKSELAMQLTEASISKNIEPPSSVWLNIASLISEKCSADIPVKAFERLMNSGSARLADKVGDGGWREEIDPGNDVTKVLSGMLWFCLGSPFAASRWRAAHVVRKLAEQKKWNYIDHLFNKYLESDAGAFQDRKQRFFQLHAQQWFLLAIARVALDYPKEMEKYIPDLKQIALNDKFPHVGFQEAAKNALLSILQNKSSSADENQKPEIEGINKSKYPESKKRGGHFRSSWEKRPENAPAEPEPSFWFEYDFEKYKISGLGELFDRPSWEVKDRMTRWIRKWDNETKSMYDFGNRPKRGDTRNFNLGTDDSYHNQGTYLAWHALAITGGELLKEFPICRHYDWGDSWNDWLSRYCITRKDGLWLADGTSSYPAIAQHELLSDKDGIPLKDPTFLLSLANIDINKKVGNIAVSGLWSSPDKVDVSITSALVPKEKTDIAIKALTSAIPSDIWLPFVRDAESDDLTDFEEYEPLVPVVALSETEKKLDGFDSFGSISSIDNRVPTKYIRESYKLISNDPWQALWQDSEGKTAFSLSTWGSQEDSRRKDSNGHTLQIESHFLEKLLKKEDKNLIILVKLQYYRESKGYHENSSSGGFSYAWAVAIIDSQRNMKIHTEDETSREAILHLAPNKRYIFQERFKAIQSFEANCQNRQNPKPQS